MHREILKTKINEDKKEVKTTTNNMVVLFLYLESYLVRKVSMLLSSSSGLEGMKK